MTFAGIDPGKTGALAIIYPDGTTEFHDVPLIVVRGKSVPAWSDWEEKWSTALLLAGVEVITIEEPTGGQNGKKQGVQSMFNFGRTLGFVHAVALTIRPKPIVHVIAPSIWKVKLGLANCGKGASREKCRTLYPSSAPSLLRVKDDGRAEAALIGHYGRKFM